jgi:hypothetical protein
MLSSSGRNGENTTGNLPIRPTFLSYPHIRARFQKKKVIGFTPLMFYIWIKLSLTYSWMYVQFDVFTAVEV